MKEKKYNVGDTVIVGGAPYEYSSGYNYIGTEAIVVDYGGYVEYKDCYVIYLELQDVGYSTSKYKFLESEIINKNSELFPIY